MINHCTKFEDPRPNKFAIIDKKPFGLPSKEWQTDRRIQSTDQHELSKLPSFFKEKQIYSITSVNRHPMVPGKYVDQEGVPDKCFV